MQKPKRIESQWIREIAYIMLKNEGPFSRRMIAEELALIHPDTPIRLLMLEVSGAIQMDRLLLKRFKVAKPGWWDLAEKN